MQVNNKQRAKKIQKDETKRTHWDCQSLDFAAHVIEYLQLNLGPDTCEN